MLWYVSAYYKKKYIISHYFLIRIHKSLLPVTGIFIFNFLNFGNSFYLFTILIKLYYTLYKEGFRSYLWKLILMALAILGNQSLQNFFKLWFFQKYISYIYWIQPSHQNRRTAPNKRKMGQSLNISLLACLNSII